MKNLKPIFNLIVIFSLFIPSIAFSRQIEDWPYKRLFKESDLVVISHVQTGFATDEEWSEKFFDKDRFKGVKTAFAVSSVLKGKAPFPCIWAKHFRYKEGAVRYNDGPSLVNFLKQPVLIELKQAENKKGKLQLQRKAVRKIIQPEYLLFLKKRKDGKYEPVSGQLDASFSVRAVLPSEHINIR